MQEILLPPGRAGRLKHFGLDPPTDKAEHVPMHFAFY